VLVIVHDIYFCASFGVACNILLKNIQCQLLQLMFVVIAL